MVELNFTEALTPLIQRAATRARIDLSEVTDDVLFERGVMPVPTEEYPRPYSEVATCIVELIAYARGEKSEDFEEFVKDMNSDFRLKTVVWAAIVILARDPAMAQSLGVTLEESQLHGIAVQFR